MYDARAIANWFVEEAVQAGAPVTHMKLQKLVYIAHGWHLGFSNGERPLFHDLVEAWRYGPVIRSVYSSFADWKDSRIEKPARLFNGATEDYRVMRLHDFVDSPAADATANFLRSVWDVYKQYDAMTLSAMTHKDGTPWQQTWDAHEQDRDRRFVIIHNETIASHYQSLAKQHRQTA